MVVSLWIISCHVLCFCPRASALWVAGEQKGGKKEVERDGERIVTRKRKVQLVKEGKAGQQ
jgi:hypothetical protein